MRTKPKLPLLQRGHPLSRGLIGAWLAYERAGTTTRDVGGYRRSGTLSSGVSWRDTSRGSAYYYASTSHTGLSLGTNVWGIANGFSFVTLFRASTGVANDFRSLFTSNALWQWRIESSNVIGLVRFDAAVNVVAAFTGTTNVKDGNWHLAVATFSTAAGSRIYVDGLQEATNATTTANRDDGANATFIGSRTNVPHDPFVGDIAMQLLYNRALTPGEVRALYADPYQAFRPRLPHIGALTASALETTTVRLTWQDNSDDEDGFRIEVSEDGAFFDEVATVGPGVTQYDDEEVPKDTTLYYRVRAYNDDGNSDYSNVAQITTAA